MAIGRSDIDPPALQRHAVLRRECWKWSSIFQNASEHAGGAVGDMLYDRNRSGQIFGELPDERLECLDTTHGRPDHDHVARLHVASCEGVARKVRVPCRAVLFPSSLLPPALRTSGRSSANQHLFGVLA